MAFLTDQGVGNRSVTEQTFGIALDFYGVRPAVSYLIVQDQNRR